MIIYHRSSIAYVTIATLSLLRAFDSNLFSTKKRSFDDSGLQGKYFICLFPMSRYGLNSLDRCFSLIVMAAPRVLVFGHSFVRRLKEFVERYSHDLSLDFGVPSINVFWHGIGGRTVRKIVSFDLHVVESFKPDIVILQLGTNDLTTLQATTVGSELEDLVRLLHDNFGVKIVCVCQTIKRETCGPAFRHKVGLLCRYLKVVLEPLPYAIYWSHRGFWNTRQRIFCADGVHLNNLGHFKLYRSMRGAVLRAVKHLNELA